MNATQLRQLQKTLKHSLDILESETSSLVDGDWDAYSVCNGCECNIDIRGHDKSCKIIKTSEAINESIEIVHQELSLLGLKI